MVRILPEPVWKGRTRPTYLAIAIYHAHHRQTLGRSAPDRGKDEDA